MFADLSLDQRLLKALTAMGLETPTPVQAQTIPAALAGKDLMVSAATGSGKTAAFLLPSLQRLLADKAAPDAGTQVLILSPTRELARQILKQCEKIGAFSGLRAALIIGGEDFKYQAALLRKNPEILIGTPGRLLEHQQQNHLDCKDLRVLILDEADRMLDLGFSEDVLKIANACNAQRQTLLFSATLHHKGLAEVARSILREPEMIGLNTERMEHTDIRQQIVPADHQQHKEQLLLWLLANEPHHKALVFTNTRDGADKLDRLLRKHKRSCGVLHGEKDQSMRKRMMLQLREGHIKVLVATDVAARGLDVEGIELVINFDMPRSGDDYVHRIGRTGRAGQQGLAISLVSAAEWNLMSSIERYLHQHFERREIKELAGSFNGPKKLKSSGKAVGKKKKDEKKPEAAPKPKPKQRLRDKKNIGKRRTPKAKVFDSAEETGFKPLRKKPVSKDQG